jgi:hypothetical protein
MPGSSLTRQLLAFAGATVLLPFVALRLPPRTTKASRVGLAPPHRMLQPCRHGPSAKRGNDEGSSGWVNTDVAAEALGVSARSVRNYMLNGDLIARKEKEGINEGYMVSVDTLYALRDRRKQGGSYRGTAAILPNSWKARGKVRRK